MKKMKVQELLQSGHSLMNNIVMDTAGLLGEAYFTIKIDDLLKERGITQKDLAQMTGMRVGTISELVNGKGISINKVQLFALMAALRVKSIDDLYEMQFPEDFEMTFENEQAEWKSTKEMPEAVKEMYKKNVLKSSGLM
ncbi:helix-turn-helix transcriptional regulator [Psychrobacillus sp. NEAU-3TGS]|uniref:helix-turn-helix domain-containing protein n=1 Tax=Psychrobacillus sp. NEAU-3TGS TaxID=2995412 RepID=UPI002499140C|nr:helix-turn-helix transcriptional regulator [Psychrobacillus sp. NEAU-3TGS]MDI2585621.1 helix-turn-helix transcriptional regulator [Psychrobacillus sp. NEAU-3TGS]